MATGIQPRVAQSRLKPTWESRVSYAAASSARSTASGERTCSITIVAAADRARAVAEPGRDDAEVARREWEGPAEDPLAPAPVVTKDNVDQYEQYAFD